MYNPQRKIYFITISMWAYLLLPPLAAQQLKKQINFGGSGTDNAMDLIKTADNNLIVIGSSSSGKSGDKNSDGFGDLDFWIVKCTPKGKILWQQTYGGDQVDEPRTILETENRDLVIAGNSMSGVSGNKKTRDVRTLRRISKRSLTTRVCWESGFPPRGIPRQCSSTSG